MKIRSFAAGDLPALMEIQNEVLSTSVWTQADYLQMHRQPGGLILVAEAEANGENYSAVVAFAASRQLTDQAEILSLAVRAHHQGRGIGRALLYGLCDEFQRAGVTQVYLEVRSSNRPAISLYLAAGFNVKYVRENYYCSPAEDACVMWMTLPQAPPIEED